jgi:hypothetical protein
MNNMRKICFLIIAGCFLSVSIVHAQKSVVGIKGGINLTSLTSDQEGDKSLKLGVHAGVYDKIAFNSLLALQPELLYNLNGLKIDYGNNAIIDGETHFNLHYLSLPVKLVVNLTKNLEIQAGPYVGYLIAASTSTNATVLDYFNISSENELDRGAFNTWDYGLTGGLDFYLDPLIIGVNYSAGLNSVAKEDEASYSLLGEAKNSVIQIFVGISF